MGGKSSSPKTPDYAGAATATAQGNLDAARAASAANRVNQNTPYGSLTYSQTPTYGADGKLNPDAGWQANYNLSPTGQKLLDASNNSSLGLADLQQGALNNTQSSLSKPFDYSSVGDVQNAAESAITSRLDPQWTQNKQQMDAQLANQGIMPGSEAYNNQMRTFNQGKNDAYQQAVLAGIQTMPQTYQMASSLRSQPLNELNAIRSGSQVQNPTFQSVPQQATTSGANQLGAMQAAYGSNLNASNASNAASNGMMGGLFNLGGSIVGAAGNSGGFSNLFSDRRLKSNIRLIGKRGKHQWYRYTIFGRQEEGVMAQEVLEINPNAVSMHPSGYYQVNYGALE